MKNSDYYKNKSDEELIYYTTALNSGAEDHQKAAAELHRRMLLVKSKDTNLQKLTVYVAIASFVLACVILWFTIAVFFKDKPYPAVSPSKRRNLKI